MAQVSIQFTPSEPRPNEAVRAIVAFSGFQGTPRIQVFIYNPVDTYPDSEDGWTYIGQVTSSGQSFDFNTGFLQPGVHYVAFLAYFGNDLVGHWLSSRNPRFMLPLGQIRIGQATVGPAPTLAPTLPYQPAQPVGGGNNPYIPDAIENIIERNQQQTMIIGGAVLAGIAALFLLRGKGGSDE